MLKATFVYVYIHIIYLYRESQTQDVGTSEVGVGQEDPTKLSPGSSNLEKPDRLTEKQLKEVSVAVDIFGMETVSYETGDRRANLGMVPTCLSPRALLKTSYYILVNYDALAPSNWYSCFRSGTFPGNDMGGWGLSNLETKYLDTKHYSSLTPYTTAK